MIDDEVRHQIAAPGERAHVVPGTKARIWPGVVDGIEARVRAIDGEVKGQQMSAAEQTLKRPFQQVLKIAESAARKAIDVGDEPGT